MNQHVHRPSRLSTPHVDLCECGAISIRYPDEPDRHEWLESTWEPPPPPPPRPKVKPETKRGAS